MQIDFHSLPSLAKPANAGFRPIMKLRALTLVLITNSGLKFSELFLQKGPITKSAKNVGCPQGFIFQVLNQVI